MDQPKPTHTWTCDCGRAMARYPRQGDQSCPDCGQWFNAGGQRLRSNWTDNPSTHDEEIGDLEGFEMSHANDH